VAILRFFGRSFSSSGAHVAIPDGGICGGETAVVDGHSAADTREPDQTDYRKPVEFDHRCRGI